MLLVLDNYDSFTYNLVQYAGELGAEPHVVRNDVASVAELLAMGPGAILVSPGPCTPREAGVSIDLIREAGSRGVPVLGVCLGHQAIGEAFGGRVVRADRLMHGKTCPVRHDATGLFAGLPTPLTVMRYHSLLVEAASLPPGLEATAWADDGWASPEIMALRHRELPVWGVQFHPESVGTEQGKAILRNFLTLAA